MTRTCFATLLAFGIASSQPRPLPEQGAAASFPTGTYTSCAHGTHTPSGNVFLNAAGFESGVRLSLAQDGSTVTSTYVDQNGLTQSLNFGASTRTLATIARKDQTIPGFPSLCVQGPGRMASYPGSMIVNAGALRYDTGVVFLTLTGALRSDAGQCGAVKQPQATFWLVCGERQGGAAAAIETPGVAPMAQLPAGAYQCSTQLASFGQNNGLNEYAAGGGTGTLTLTDQDATVTARYSGDADLAGALRFTATTATTARAEAGQSVMTPCISNTGTGRNSVTPEMASITAGALTWIDSTLFLSIAGTMATSSSCAGAKVAASVICSRQRAEGR